VVHAHVQVGAAKEVCKYMPGGSGDLSVHLGEGKKIERRVEVRAPLGEGIEGGLDQARGAVERLSGWGPWKTAARGLGLVKVEAIGRGKGGAGKKGAALDRLDAVGSAGAHTAAGDSAAVGGAHAAMAPRPLVTRAAARSEFSRQ